MNRFEYSRPTSVADAIGLLSDQPEQVAPLAGGTDLLSLMKDFVVEPKRLVSLRMSCRSRYRPMAGLL